MPMPAAYRDASKAYRAFLDDLKNRTGLVSDNSAYTAADAVLQVFRRRLDVAQALAFADTLPAVLRAIFVHGWDAGAAPLPFGSRPEMTAEAQAVRKDHNLTPDDAIEAVAWALRRQVNARDFDRVLARIGPDAQAFWHVEVDDPSDLGRRFP